jgi:Arc/MetJ-type ribon-helix-helix transcriptional regulator
LTTQRRSREYADTIKMRRTSITLTDKLEEMLNEMVKSHGCNSSSDYLAGLILLDFLRTKGLLDVSQIDILPAWLLRGHLVEVEKGKAKPGSKSK